MTSQSIAEARARNASLKTTRPRRERIKLNYRLISRVRTVRGQVFLANRGMKCLVLVTAQVSAKISLKKYPALVRSNTIPAACP